MALLDMQGMEQESSHGHHHGSHLSVALCASQASITLCL